MEVKASFRSALDCLVTWAKRAWRLKGDVNFQKLSQKLFFMGFESVEEA